MPSRNQGLLCACLLLVGIAGWSIRHPLPESQATGEPGENPHPASSSTRKLPGGSPSIQQVDGEITKRLPVGNGAFPIKTGPAEKALPANPEFLPLGENFLADILSADASTIQVTLPGGGVMKGNVDSLRWQQGTPQRIQGVVTQPEAGRFMFQRQTVPGKAGDLVGYIHFDQSSTAYKVRPLAAGGRPALLKTHVGDVICRGLAAPPPHEIPPTHPTDFPIPPDENGIIQLQSKPGAIAVVYIDYDGEERNFDNWGYVDAQPYPATNSQIHEVWKGVSEDYQPFDINITTIRSVYDAAPEGSRMHVIVTPTTTVAPASGGIAYVDSFNWTGGPVCWAFFGTGKNGVEVISHEVGHTLGLSHHGTSTEEYYEGHTGWAPIMGTGYDQVPSQWSRGEYDDAFAYNGTPGGEQDDLAIISTENNNVGYRSDDHADTHASATWLEVSSGGEVANEGVIENSADEDAFRFSTTGGTLSLDIRAVLAHPNLDLKAEILTSAGALIATHDPSNSLNAFFSGLYLLEGDYFLRVSGVGRGNLSTGYSDYASLGAYTVTGTINGGVPAERFSVAENSPAATIVGTVVARADHGAGVLSYAILSGNTGNTFSLHPDTGEITVDLPMLLNFESLSPTWEIPASFELFIQITDSLGVASETLRTVVSVSDVNEAPDFPTPETATVPEQVTLGTEVARVVASDPDRGDYVTYSIISGNTGNAFVIDAETGVITTAGPLDFETTPSYALGIRATDHLTPSNFTDAVLSIDVLDLAEDLVPGGVMRTVFREIPGSSVESLVIHPRFSVKPHAEEILPSLDSGDTEGDEYGSTLRALLIAPVSGNYTFWISADDAAELHLSTDDDPQNSVFRASLSSWANRNDFTKYTSQQSASVSLTAGQSYYLEVRHKESTGGDHVQVAWQPPGTMAPSIIPGKFLVPYQEDYAPWANDQTLIVRPAAANGHVIGRLAFVEPDLGETITSFSIVSGNEAGVFAINPANGNLEVANGGALVEGDIYQLTVSATDNGSPALQGTAIATIEVVGLHDRLHTWWKLDETDGTQVADASSNGRDAQVSGTANWISRGAANPALELDGTTSGVSYPGSDALAGSTSFTLAAWVRLPSSHASDKVILQQQQGGAGGDIGRYVVHATSTGAVRFSLYGADADGGNEGYQFDITSAVTIHDNQWHHVACVRDGAEGRIFIDGVLQGTGSGTPRVLNPFHTVAVGKNVRNNSAFLAGTIDDVRIYADALNGVQIMKAAGTPKVAVLSPVAGRADIPPDTGLMLEAAASDPDGPAPLLEWSLVSGPGSVTFGSPEDEETTAVFSAAGTYTLRIQATDGDNASSSTVHVNSGTTASSPFGGQTIGSGSPGSHFGVGEQFVILTGESAGVEGNGTQDACYLLGQVFSGDFDVRARITSVSDVELSSAERAGIMIRAGTTPDASAVSGFIGLDAGGDLRWIRRSVGSGANLETVVGAVMVPEWCRITRSGDTLNFLHSPDGLSWTSIGTMTLGGELTAGLCWSSGSAGNNGAAAFDGINGFSQSNVGPLVNAGEDSELVAAVPGEILGLVEDDGLPSPSSLVSNWVQVGGTASVNVASPSSAISAVTCPDEDAYVMRLIADDGAVRTFDDVTLNSTIVNTVSVVATDSDASENGPDPGTITFFRGGSLIGDLTVNFTISGSATNGVDYDLIPSSIVIPDGEEELVITINPVDDQVGEGVENVILTLDTGDYQIFGNPAEVIIADFNYPPVWSGSPLLWPGAFAGNDYVGPSLATETSDPDGDELFYTKLSGPAWLSIASDGTLSGTPANGDIGMAEFDIRVNDTRGFFADAVLRIQVDFFNVAPVFNGPVTPVSATALFAYEGQTLAAFASDANLVQGDTLTFTKLAGAPWVQVAADGSLTGNPTNDHVGFNFFTVRVTDAAGLFANATVQLIVMPALLHLDANGEEPGSGAPTAATWGASAVWSLSSAGVSATTPWVDGAVAVFSAGEDAVASNITLDGPRIITALTVEEGQPNLTGGSLVMAGAPTEFMVASICTIASPMSGVDGGLFKTGAGDLVLSGSNTYTGDTYIESGTLELSSTGRLYQGGAEENAVITIASGAKWKVHDFSAAGSGLLAADKERRILDGGTLEITGPSHTSDRNFTITSSGGTLRYTAANGELTLAGNAGDNIEVAGPLVIEGDGDITLDEVLEGAGDVTKSGNGTLQLNAANTLTGSIAVTAGELRLNGSVPSSEGMNVQAAATLSGSGTFTPPLTLAGTLAPGDGVGVLTTGPLNFESGARIEWQAGDWSAAPNAGHDRIEAASADLTDATGLVIAVNDEDITNFSNNPSSFVVLRSTAPITGFDINQFEIDATGFTAGLGDWALVIQGNDLVLEYSPLPPFEAWQITEFGPDAENPAVAGETADPDQDGAINVMEYALASDPNASEPASWFVDRVTVEGTEYLRMHIQRNPAATDVTYTVETAGDLAGPGSWSSATTFIEEDTPSELVVRDTLSGPQRFIRLRVTR